MRRIRLRHIADVNPSTPEFDGLADDASVTFLPLECVWPGGSLDTSRIRTKAEVASGYTRFREGDLLVPKITPTFQADRSTIARGLVGGVGAGTTELHIVRPSPEVDARYILYSLKSRSFLLGGEAAMFGVAGQQRVPDDFLRDWLITIPGLVEQHAIADYLDAETARIDAVVERRSRQIDLLQERARSVLLRTLPALSEARCRLKMVVAIAAGGTPATDNTADWGDDGDLSWVSIGDMRDGEQVVRTSKHVTAAGVASARLKVGSPGAVLLAMYASVGVSAYLGIHAAWNQAILGLEPLPDRADAGFLGYWLELLRDYWPRVVKSNTQDNLTAELVRDAPFPLLTVHRQAELASHLDLVNDEMRRRASLLRRSIGLLLERRQALITAAVTGQLEIPGVAA